jgi:hypothetical protein
MLSTKMTLSDHEFNTIKYSLPFWFRTDKTQFFNELNSISNAELSDFQVLDLFYTLHAIGVHSVWFRYFVKIFNDLSLINKINLLKFVSGYIHDPNDIEELKTLYNEVFQFVKDEDLLLEIVFLNRKFFKPLLSSRLTSMKSLNPELYKFLVDRCLELLSSNEKKLYCLERLIHLRNLTKSEYSLLEDILTTNPNYSGRIIDCFLRANDSKFIIKGLSLIVAPNIEPTQSDNAVHYFEISKDYLEEFSKMQIQEGQESKFALAVLDFLEVSRLISNVVAKGVYSVADLLISSGYKYKGVKIEFLINFLVLVGAITQKTFLILNTELQEHEKAISILKEKYDVNDNIWLDPEAITNELEKIKIE